MSELSKYRVMFDLSPAVRMPPSFMFSGIPQETRLIFEMFAHATDIELAGLIIPTDPCGASVAGPMQLSGSIHNLLFQKTGPLFGLQILKYVLKFKSDIPSPMFMEDEIKNTIWRAVFSTTSRIESKEFMLNKAFYVSELSQRICTLFALLRLPRPIVRVPSKYEFAIFQGIKFIGIPAGITKISRYLDSIPLQSPDTLGGRLGKIIRINKRVIRYFERNDEIICCPSEYVKKSLLHYGSKIREDNVFVMPACIAQYNKATNTRSLVHIIVKNNINSVWNDESPFWREQQQKIRKDLSKDFTYLLIVSTLEPRKNYINLIKAWARYRVIGNKDIKLIIVGSIGWECDAILRAMEVHIMDANLFHLSQLTKEDMAVILSNAEALLSLSYNEGFGYAPLEAMQCGTPTLVSDIPTHREVYGEASLYADPNNIEDIIDKIRILLGGTGQSVKLKNTLIARGYERAKLYYPKVIVEKWLTLFEVLRKRKRDSK